MDSINFVPNLQVESEKSSDNYKMIALCSNIFYCYDVFKGIFIPVNINLKYKNEHKLIGIRPYNDKTFYLWYSFLVLPVFLYRNMLFSVNTDFNLKLLKSDTQIKELKFSIDEVFRLNNRAGQKIAKILSKRDPDYSYVINNISKLKKDLLGAFHYLISVSCVYPHKGKLEEEIKDKIENNII